jgi:hypothetical protein
VQHQVLPHLEPYAQRGLYPYPKLVAEQLQRNPIFDIQALGGEVGSERRFLGFDPERDGLGD